MESEFLWITQDPAPCREAVESAAREFKLRPVFTSPDDCLDALRGVRCDMIGIEFGVDPHPGLALLRELRDRVPRTTLLAASSDTTVSVMRAALEAGAADLLSLPLTRHELHKAFIKFVQLRDRTYGVRAEAGDLVAVCAARGGLGATTLAVNLAVRLRALTGSETGLVDLDLQRGDVSAFLNLTPTQSIASVATARSEVDDIFLHSTLTRHSSGVFVLAAPPHIDEAEVIGHGDVDLALRLLRGQFRYTVVDTPRTITSTTLPALEQADRILVLADLSVPGVRAAQRLFDLLGRLGGAREHAELLLTQSRTGPIPVKDAVRALGKEPFAVLPHDEAASNAMNSGAPLNGARPSPLAVTIDEIAAKLSGVEVAPKPRGGGQLLRRIFTREART